MELLINLACAALGLFILTILVQIIIGVFMFVKVKPWKF